MMLSNLLPLLKRTRQHASDLQTACQNLLDEVLKSAGLVDQFGSSFAQQAVRLIDLGIGCADQTIYMSQEYPWLYRCYVGVTIDSAQLEFAQQRLKRLGILDNTANGKSVQVFRADAAQPERWSDSLNNATEYKNVDKSIRSSTPATSSDDKLATSVLALDCLYHFRPSREPLFDHAFKELKASIMAFDLLLADKPSLLGCLLVRILAMAMSCPWQAFLTKAEYRAQLMKAGFRGDGIEIRDISEHVFEGLANFIETRDRELEMYLGKGIGSYKAFAWILRWWVKTGIIRGCIVTARR